MAHIAKTTLTLTNTTAGRTYRTGDLIGSLLAVKYTNVTMTSDVKLSLFRSSSTHANDRILAAKLATGTTQILRRPRVGAIKGGTTGAVNFAFTALPATSMGTYN